MDPMVDLVGTCTALLLGWGWPVGPPVQHHEQLPSRCGRPDALMPCPASLHELRAAAVPRDAAEQDSNARTAALSQGKG